MGHEIFLRPTRTVECSSDRERWLCILLFKLYCSALCGSLHFQHTRAVHLLLCHYLSISPRTISLREGPSFYGSQQTVDDPHGQTTRGRFSVCSRCCGICEWVEIFGGRDRGSFQCYFALDRSGVVASSR
jgi:hypothetical protein